MKNKRSRPCECLEPPDLRFLHRLDCHYNFFNCRTYFFHFFFNLAASHPLTKARADFGVSGRADHSGVLPLPFLAPTR